MTADGPIALDTNVIVRFLVNDDRDQARRAKACLEQASAIWISKTVLLETEWVLRAVYDFTPGAISAALKALLGLPRVEAEHPSIIAKALETMAAGLDFADALHVASTPGETKFLTFDRELIKRATAIESSDVVLA